ncbi:glycosyltransferase 61 family protein [Pseudomonas asiatica]|uniref:glycosyltransferase family 61 protein n=1 Tax=Pseudomonas TaxID=286 RepID=UPI002E7C0D56|nr:glycosyltransferase 61 family protein [Pseudomonas asiatica]MEE1918370.1 glycosyltransferase 61 family protein [Pseudomonas asiatica]
MRKIHSSSHFSIASTFDELQNSSKDVAFVAQPINANYSTSTSQVKLAEHPPEKLALSRRIGCSFLNEEMSIPALLVHKIHNPSIYPGKIRARDGSWHSHGQLLITSANSLCPESYGIMDGGRTLPKDLLTATSDRETFTLNEPLPQEHLKGNYLFLGSMHDHFGHFLVEGLSRLWILKHFSDTQIADLKIIIYEPGLIPPATKILSYLGIDKSQIHFLSEPCTVDSVIAPSIAYRTHFWARDVMNYVYNKISAAARAEKQTDFPTKIFLSRSHVSARRLKNEAEIEQIHRDAGYWVLRPEDIPIGDQIRIAANADSIAGCTGSNMYLAMFQKLEGRNFIYAPYDFTLKDDAIISQLRSSRLSYVLGTQLHEDQWTIDATLVAQTLKDEAHS